MKCLLCLLVSTAALAAAPAERFSVLQSFRLSGGFTLINQGQDVSLSRVRGPHSQGFLLYATAQRENPVTVAADKGLFFETCWETKPGIFEIDEKNQYDYLCVHDGAKLVPVGFVSSATDDPTEPLFVENLCSDDEFYDVNTDELGHRTAAVCDIGFVRGLPYLTLKNH